MHDEKEEEEERVNAYILIIDTCACMHILFFECTLSSRASAHTRSDRPSDRLACIGIVIVLLPYLQDLSDAEQARLDLEAARAQAPLPHDHHGISQRMKNSPAGDLIKKKTSV